MADTDFLKLLTETPSIGTACGPMIRLMSERFGGAYTRTLVEDGFCLFQKAGASPEDLRIVFVAHLDEIGGCVYGALPDGGYATRVWGNVPSIFAAEPLQAFDYLIEDASDAYPVRGAVVQGEGEERMALYGDGIRSYRTGWTFLQETVFDGDDIIGKALDPRVTAYAVAEAVRAIDSPEVGACFVMAEECAMDVARKAVTFLSRCAPHLELVANADVPGVQNLGDARLDLPAIRIFEGRNFIDPSFGIRTSEYLQAKGVAHHLSAARSGSQTLLFTPLARTLSIALPCDGIHLPRGRMSLTGAERCVTLLRAIGERGLAGEL